MHRKLIGALGAVTALSIIAFGASACGDDDADAEAASTSSTQSVALGASYLDKAGLHDIDESINTDKKVPSTARTVMLQAAAVVRTTDWPSGEDAAAKSLGDTMEQLADVLGKDPVDMAKAGELAAKVHDDAHDFTHEIWNHVYEEADLPVAGGGHD